MLWSYLECSNKMQQKHVLFCINVTAWERTDWQQEDPKGLQAVICPTQFNTYHIYLAGNSTTILVPHMGPQNCHKGSTQILGAGIVTLATDPKEQSKVLRSPVDLSLRQREFCININNYRNLSCTVAFISKHTTTTHVQLIQRQEHTSTKSNDCAGKQHH